MDINLTVAENVKRIREQKKMTLDAAAAATGVSRSMLAQIEKGDVNPTISVLWKIANGFKVSFTSLVDQAREQPVVVRGGDIHPVVESDGRYVNYPTFLFDERKSFEIYRIHILKGGCLEAAPHLTGSEEYVTVFSGRAEIGVGEERYTLENGDSLRFPADQPHSYHNPGEGDVWLSMLIWYET